MPAEAQRVCFTIWFTDARRQRAAHNDGRELLRDALQRAAVDGGE